MSIEIYTDGSSTFTSVNEEGKGGCAFVAVNDDSIISKGGKHLGEATNSKSELLGILEAVKYFNKSKYHNCVIYSDSMYCINALEKWHVGWEKRGWKKSDGEDVMYKEIIQEILSIKGDIKIVYVKAHSDNKYNELADELANKYRKNV